MMAWVAVGVMGIAVVVERKRSRVSSQRNNIRLDDSRVLAVQSQ